MKNIIKKIQKNITLRRTTEKARKFFGACMMFAMVTSWVYGIIPGLENVSPQTKTAEAASAWSIRQEINILDGYLGAATATYATSSEIINIDTTKYSGTVSYYLEVVASSSSALATNFYLKNQAGQTITTLNPSLTTSYELYRSANFTPTAGANDYVVVVGNESGATKGVIAARIIILQSFADTANSAATSTQTQIEIGNKETGKSNTTNSALTNPKYWTYDADKWDGTISAYAEVTFKNTQISSSTTYSTDGTFTYIGSVGVSYVTVEAWGAGGGGGNAASGGGGGGGGAYVRSTTTVVARSSNTLVVGNGPSAETNGGNSTYNSTTVIAEGGKGASNATGGAGGNTTVSVGQVETAGGLGGNADTGPDTGGGGGGSGGPSGVGSDGQGGQASTGGAGGLANGGGGLQSPSNGGNNAACPAGNGAAGTSAATGGNGGGGSDGACTSGGTGGAPGGGGGGADSTGGTSVGGDGQIKLTETHGAVGFALEKDNGAFGSWTFVKMIATTTRGISTSTPLRLRSDAFTPEDGLHYRIVASTTHASATYDVYNAKIVVDQGPGWSLVGSGFSIPSSFVPAIAALSSTRVAYFDTGLQSLRTYDFDGSNWSLVGSGFSIPTSGSPALAALSSTRVAYFDHDLQSLRAYDFDGSTWSLVGSGFSIPGAGYPALAALSSTRVAYYDYLLGQLRAYDFNGSTWSLVGSGFSIPGAGYSALAALSSTRVAYYDDTNESLRTYDFDGSTWSLVGSGFSIPGATVPALTGLSSTRVAYFDHALESLRTYDFDGSTWSLVGSGFSIPGVDFPALAALSSTRIAYFDHTLESLRAYDFNSLFTKLEPQYLLSNTSVSSGTSMQGYKSWWRPSEWVGVSNTYLHAVDSADGATSVVVVAATSTNTTVTNSSITLSGSYDQHATSTSALTMPVADNGLDTKVTTNNNDVYGSRILVQVAVATTIGGTVYTAPDGATPATSKTIQLYKNGATSLGSGVTDGSGVYSIALGASIVSGDIITAYVDGDTDGVTVYVSDGTSKSDIDIYQGALIVRQDTGSGITNANLTTGIVSGDTGDMVYTTDGSNNLTVASNVELHVWTGDTYTPGATVTTQGTGDLHLDDSSTATLGSGTSDIADDIFVDTGATININSNIFVRGGSIMTAGTGIVTNTSGSPTVNILGTGTLGGGSNALTFYTVSIADGAVITSSNSATISGDLQTIGTGSLVFSGGTVTMSSVSWGIANAGTLTFSGLTISQTPTVQPSSSFSVGGALTVSASKTLAPTAGTITMINSSSISNSGTLNFYNLDIAGTITTSSTFGVTNNFTSSSGSLSTSGGTITVTNDLSVAGTISGSGSITVNGGDVTGNGTLNFSSGSFILDGSGLFGGNTSWIFNQLFFGDGSGVATTTSIGTNSITAATTTVRANQILDAGVSKTWNFTASHEPFGLQGTLLASSSTFSFQGANNATVTPATYYNLEFAPASGNPTYVLGTTTGQTITINNNFTIAGSGNVTVNADTRDPIVNVAGNMTVGTGDTFQTSSASTATITGDLSVSGTLSGTGSVTVSGGDTTGAGTLNLSGGTFTLSGTGSFGSDTAWTFNNLTFGVGGSGTVTSIGTGGVSITNTLMVATNQLLNAGGKTYSLTGVGTPFVVSGTWNVGTSTVSYDATAGGQTITSTTYYNLTVAPASGTNTFTFAAGTVLINKDFTISNTTNPTVTANTNNPTITVAGTFTIGSGTTFVAPPTSLLTLAGNFTNNGTFTANGGTVVFSTTTSSIISSTADMSFYNFRAIIPGATLKFQKHTANVPTFTIAGTMTVTGSESTPVYLESDIQDSDWMISFSGAQSAITYTSIRDSACAGGSASVTSYITNTNRGNNDSCWGFLLYSMFSSGPASVEQGSGGGTLVTGGGNGSGGGSVEQGGGEGSGQSGGGGGGGGGEVSP